MNKVDYGSLERS